MCVCENSCPSQSGRCGGVVVFVVVVIVVQADLVSAHTRCAEGDTSPLSSLLAPELYECYVGVLSTLSRRPSNRS